MITHSSVSRRSLVFAVGILMVLVLGISAVIAQQLPQPDGRINQIADLGGDALYCMDASNNVTNDWTSLAYLQLLNSNGQPLWTLTRAMVEKGADQVKYGEPPVLLGSGTGSYGAFDLYANAAQDGTPYYIFVGVDDHYKPVTLIFYGCTPVGSALSAPTATPIMIG